MEECLDGLARITSKELATTHFVKSGTLQNACSTRPRVVVGSGKSAAHRQVDEQPSKRSKKNDDKSAVAKLKKGDWQERGSVYRPMSQSIKSWNEDLLNVDHLIHCNWVV